MINYEQSDINVKRMAPNTQKNKETRLCLNQAKRRRYHQRRSIQAFQTQHNLFQYIAEKTRLRKDVRADKRRIRIIRKNCLQINISIV